MFVWRLYNHLPDSIATINFTARNFILRQPWILFFVQRIIIFSVPISLTPLSPSHSDICSSTSLSLSLFLSLSESRECVLCQRLCSPNDGSLWVCASTLFVSLCLSVFYSMSVNCSSLDLHWSCSAALCLSDRERKSDTLSVSVSVTQIAL